MLFLKLSAIAASVKIDPSIGPIQGVHPNPKAIPTIKGKLKLSLNLLVKNLTSLFINWKFIKPSSCRENKIIIIPAIILKVFELFKKKPPIIDAAEPKIMKTEEKPNAKKIIFRFIKWLFFLTSLL